MSSDRIETVISQAQEYMRSHRTDGWLLYDYRGMNPIFWDTLGPVPNVTRPCWLWIPSTGDATLLVAYVDQGRFAGLGLPTVPFAGRRQMRDALVRLLQGSSTIAMEYSPSGEMPRVSKVDAGTLEMVRGLGPEVVSSADLLQYATQRWDGVQLSSHRQAAERLGRIVLEAFDHIGEALGTGITEFGVAEFIRDRFAGEGLTTSDGPVVAVNEHSSDPHFEPT